ncbi:MAG: hypothetical protein ACEPOW_08915 [Bacteroidales bacterium]
MCLPYFNAKILLFGEYGVMFNSKGLIFPYNSFRGQLLFSCESEMTSSIKQSNYILRRLVQFIQVNNFDSLPYFKFDIDQLKYEVEKNLYFRSNIPQGYGVGSSGAIVAALFDRYTSVKYKKSNLSQVQLEALKEILSDLELMFHGKSSGFDPLTSYLNKPILVNNSLPEICSIDYYSKRRKPFVFLVDTNISRQSDLIIKKVLNLLKRDSFKERFVKEMLVYNSLCIDSYLDNNQSVFYDAIGKLSEFQLKYLSESIPDNILSFWRNGLELGMSYLKLCGAGGGGYLIGFCRNYSDVLILAEKYQTNLIRLNLN